MAKYCKYCGAQLEEDDAFCGNCGKAIPAPGRRKKLECPNCGIELKGTEKFCKSCGYSLTGQREDAENENQEKAAPKWEGMASKLKQQSSAVREYADSNSSFYIVDFAKNMVRSGNIPSLIYLILNVAVITLILSSRMSENPLLAIAGSLLIYLFSVMIALSPIGEFLVRFQAGCKKITDPQVLQRIQPVFDTVYRQAKQQNQALPDTIKLYMNEDKCPNAFATGRKTVCITRGLLQLPDPYIEAILGHEFGHLSHHDTDMLLVITVGNLFISFFVMIGRIFINFMLLIAAMFVESELGVLMHRFVSFMCGVSINLILSLWTGLGVLLTMKTSRANEYEADHFSGVLGYGRTLADALEFLEGGSGGGRPQGVFAALSASHPPTKDRVERLRADF